MYTVCNNCKYNYKYKYKYKLDTSKQFNIHADVLWSCPSTCHPDSDNNIHYTVQQILTFLPQKQMIVSHGKQAALITNMNSVLLYHI